MLTDGGPAGSAPIAEGDPGAHSDGACYSRWRLQATAYLDDVPPDSGGFTVREPEPDLLLLFWFRAHAE